MSRFVHLRELDISHNMLTSLEGLGACTALRVLNVSDNHIEDVSGLDYLPLEELDISRNRLTRLRNLRRLPSLEVLHADGNKLEGLRGLKMCGALHTLTAANNRVHNVYEVEHLQPCRQLQVLSLASNTVTRTEKYRARVLYRLPWLRELDGVVASAEEKVKADTAHGTETEARAAHLDDFIPGEPFTDPTPPIEEPRARPDLEDVTVGPKGRSVYTDLAQSLVADALAVASP
jgi:hypothetical protein